MKLSTAISITKTASNRESAMQEDTHHTIKEIRDNGDQSLVDRLVDIQKYRREKQKSVDWADNLQVLRPRVTKVRRRGSHGPDATNIFERYRTQDRNYAAISYPCNHSHYERTDRTFYVKDMENGELVKSRVRDSIISRVMLYLDHHDIPCFWIDQDCINQDDEEERQRAMESMDLVYKNSPHAVALLFVPIRTQRELDLLGDLLQGKLVHERKRNKEKIIDLADWIEHDVALEILTLLHRITSDQWFNRGWTYQEEYLAGDHMRILMPHFRGLRKHHLKRVFGNYTYANELEINASTFRRELTKFCIAYLDDSPQKEWQADAGCCYEIIARAGRYSTLSDYGNLIGYDTIGKSMSSSIFADIGARDISIKSDVLHIAGNCCNYATSMNTLKLMRDKRSLSLSILALFLMNGELIWNHREDNTIDDMLSHQIFDYMKHISFDKFNPPVDFGRLSFLKCCRFISPELTNAGITTWGHLWRIEESVDLNEYRINPRIKRRKGSGVMARDEDYFEIENDKQTIHRISELLEQDHSRLADQLKHFLEHEWLSDNRWSGFSRRQTMTFIAMEVARAAVEGKCIGLGHIVQTGSSTSQVNGVSKQSSKTSLGLFVLDDLPTPDNPSYVFTAWQSAQSAKRKGKKEHAPLDNLVTLEVWVGSDEHEESVDDQGVAVNRRLPRLTTRKWVHSLAFFDEAPRSKVIFPWPKSLSG